MGIRYSSIGSKILLIPILLGSKTGKQTLMLYFAQLIGIPLEILTSSIVARSLGPNNYGILALCTTVKDFVLIFSDLRYQLWKITGNTRDDDKCRHFNLNLFCHLSI